MALMVPEVPNLDAIPASERRVYMALTSLPDEYRVFHSVSYYVGPDGPAPMREGEADFVILHPERGLLALEVKGGEVSYDGRERRWYSTDRKGQRNAISDPFRQAQFHEKAIAGEIERSLGTSVVHGHGVVFPDCEYRLVEEKQPIGHPRMLVVDAADMAADFRGAIDRLYGHWANGRPSHSLGARALKKLSQNVLAPRFQLCLSLASAIAAEDNGFCRLSYEQDVCLDFLDLNPRVVIEGSAGTGKTVIALEAGRRFASRGESVLLLCFNRPLAGLLRERCASLETDHGSLRAATFHDVCRDFAREAGVAWSAPEGNRRAETERFYNETAPGLLAEAEKRLPARFDVLIVDEAQDFLSSWWPSLLGLLRNPDSDPFVAFLDPEQDLWGRKTVLPTGLPRFPLRLNQRNTRAIADHFAPFGVCQQRLTQFTPEGAPVVVKTYSTLGEERRLIEDQIKHLLFYEKLDSCRLAILGTHHIEHSFLAERQSLCGIPVDAIGDDGSVAAGTLSYSTPRRFKGLEADVILLCDVDGEGHACSRRDLYVAMSRARHRLYVFSKSGAELPGNG